MRHIIIVCEGETEQEFSRNLLSPFFLKQDAIVYAPKFKHSNGGIVPWATLKTQLTHHLLHEPDAIVTTLIDYYRIKRSYAYPGWESAQAITDIGDRLATMQHAMLQEFDENLRHRFVPYIQFHEFEALLFSDIEALKSRFDIDKTNMANLQKAVDSHETPEHINNQPATAPSVRLIKAIPGYDKTLDGMSIAQSIGLDKIRAKCPLFNRWLEQLTALCNG